jgi:hypothetical protein
MVWRSSQVDRTEKPYADAMGVSSNARTSAA